MSPEAWIGVAAAVVAVVGPYLTYKVGRKQTDTTALGQVWTRMAEMEEDQRTLQDYCMDLRDALETAGAPVPPWPSELRRSRKA